MLTGESVQVGAADGQKVRTGAGVLERRLLIFPSGAVRLAGPARANLQGRWSFFPGGTGARANLTVRVAALITDPFSEHA
jgi:hypothetical protein